MKCYVLIVGLILAAALGLVDAEAKQRKNADKFGNGDLIPIPDHLLNSNDDLKHDSDDDEEYDESYDDDSYLDDGKNRVKPAFVIERLANSRVN